MWDISKHPGFGVSEATFPGESMACRKATSVKYFR